MIDIGLILFKVLTFGLIGLAVVCILAWGLDVLRRARH
jgi:hypothetical protein